MNTETGKLMIIEDLMGLPGPARKKFVAVRRDLTVKERSEMQIRLYAPCGCGSGKKFKFCCKTK